MSNLWERAPIAAEPLTALVIVGHDAARLAEAVEVLAAELADLRREHELLICDTGESSELTDAARQLAERRRHTQVLAPDGGTGYGAALRSGIKAARFPLVFSIAADGGYQLNFLHYLLTMIDQVDVVVGFRPERRGLGHRVKRWLAGCFFGLEVKDPLCPVRLYRRSIFDRLPIQSETRFAEAEILAKANFMTCLMAEAAVPWRMPEAVNAGPSLGRDARRLFLGPRFLPSKPS